MLIGVETIDPNIVYLLLVFGLWLSVTAAYMPGSGVVEVLAGLMLIGAIIILAAQPTNWVAVILVVVGVLSFMIMPFIKQQFVPLSIGGLLLQAGGGFFMFHGQSVSPVIIALTVGIALVYHRYGLMPILARVRQQTEVAGDTTNVVGAYGRVVKALNPTGTVNVRGELWTATSNGKDLNPGDTVLVVEQEGLQLFVEGVKPKGIPQNGYEEHV